MLEDVVVLPLLGAKYRALVEKTPQGRKRIWSRGARAFAVARTRLAEDAVARGVAENVRQYCLLGAGLDTFAWRNPFGRLWTWEVDLPAMREWKMGLAGEAGLNLPPRCTGVAADCEEPGLAAALETGGMSRERTVFACLGVAPYLSANGFRNVLDVVRRHGKGSVLVMDYRLPETALGEEERRQHESLAARVRDSGEPFRQFWTPEQMRQELRGFSAAEDMGASELNNRFFAGRQDGLSVCGEAVRIVCGVV